MKFYLCSLPLCLLLVLAIFQSCDGQLPRKNPQRMSYQRPGQRQKQMPKKNNQNGGTCLLEGKSFRVGAKIITKCRLCTCLQNGRTQCSPINCMHCNSYSTLRTNPCCSKCRKSRRQPGEFDFEEGIAGEDRQIADPNYLGSSDGSSDVFE